MASLAPAPGSGANVRFITPARGSRARLRVGVFADCARQPRWLFEALARVAASDCAELAFVSAGNRRAAPSPSILGLYRALDRRAFGADGAEERDIELLVAPERRTVPDEPAIDVAFAIGDVDDVALAVGARHGVWRYCFGEQHEVHEPLAGVREVFGAHPVVASGLRIRRARRNRSRGVRLVVARRAVLARAHAGDPDAQDLDIPRARAARPARARPVVARGVDAARGCFAPWHGPGCCRAAGRRGQGGRARGPPHRRERPHRGPVAARLSLRRHEAWSGSLDGFQRLVPPADRFWADPFPITVDGRHYIFFEELPFASGKGHISVVEVDAAGKVSEPRRVLERDYHLSYPFLVEDHGRLYMIPETASNRTVEIYRCVEFPHRWKLERVLLRDLWCADATLHRDADRWWMFASCCVDGGEMNDELNLFHAESLLGEWRPHRRNPVRSDVRGGRPAGRIFAQDGELYRPGQVCTPIYGAAIALNRITRLDEHGYAEEEVRRIPPAGPGLIGMHTINRAGTLSVTDVFLRRPRWEA